MFHKPFFYADCIRDNPLSPFLSNLRHTSKINHTFTLLYFHCLHSNRLQSLPPSLFPASLFKFSTKIKSCLIQTYISTWITPLWTLTTMSHTQKPERHLANEDSSKFIFFSIYNSGHLLGYGIVWPYYETYTALWYLSWYLHLMLHF